MNDASASAADTVPEACSTSVCRLGAHELAATLTPATAAPASSASVARSTKRRVDFFWML
jgi:hypothetical protein